MPFITIDGYKFGFFSSDCDEPPHVHVLKAEHKAKIWLTPVELAWNRSYNTREMDHILKLTQENRRRLLEMWHEHCNQA